MIYLIGIGPGNPELLTLQAVRHLKEADYIFAPHSNDQGRSVSESIILPHIEKSKLIEAYIPMTRDKAVLDSAYNCIITKILSLSERSNNIAFVTLGDVMIYSTAWNLAQRLALQGVDINYIPGIPTAIAAANHAGFCLTIGQEQSLITPMPNSIENLADCIVSSGTTVIMKINHRISILEKYVEEYKPKSAFLIHRLGLDNELVIDLLKEKVENKEIGYLSIALIRKN